MSIVKGFDAPVIKKLNKKIYELAAQIVLKGHCKGNFAKDRFGFAVDPESEVAVAFCASASLAIAQAIIEGQQKKPNTMAIAFDPIFAKSRHAFESFIGIHQSHTGGNICDWNNEPSRTPEEIAAKFREFAKTL